MGTACDKYLMDIAKKHIKPALYSILLAGNIELNDIGHKDIDKMLPVFARVLLAAKQWDIPSDIFPYTLEEKRAIADQERAIADQKRIYREAGYSSFALDKAPPQDELLKRKEKSHL